MDDYKKSDGSTSEHSHSIGQPGSAAQPCLTKQEKEFRELLKELGIEQESEILPRKQFILCITNWIKKNGTDYEARACEVAGDHRLKRINGKRIIRGEVHKIKPKLSLSVRKMKDILYLIEKSGANKPRLLGRTLPENYDLSQVSVSEQAENLINS